MARNKMTRYERNRVLDGIEQVDRVCRDLQVFIDDKQLPLILLQQRIETVRNLMNASREQFIEGHPNSLPVRDDKPFADGAPKGMVYQVPDQ